MPGNQTLAEGLLRREEVAKRLDISLTTLDTLVKKGVLRPIRQHRRWVRFRVEDIEEYIGRILRQSETSD